MYGIYIDNMEYFIEEATERHFERKYGNQKVECNFEPKTSGSRTGLVCTIKVDGHCQVYYLKTNHFSTGSALSRRPPLKMNELFIYSFMEVLGLGANVEFVGNVVGSDNIIYIAGKEVESFKTLEMIQKDWTTFEKRIVNKRETIRRAIVRLSLLTQMLGLGDLNPGNIGFRETDYSLYVVDFSPEKVDKYVGFEDLNRPKNALSLVNKLKLNLGRFYEFVKNMTLAEQLKIAQETLIDWEIHRELDVAVKKFNDEKPIFGRDELDFARGTESLKEYAETVHQKINIIANL